MVRKRKFIVQQRSRTGYYVAVLVIALVLGGVYYELQGSSNSTQGTLKIFGVSDGVYVAASVTVTGSSTFTGTTTLDLNNPLKFDLNPGSYMVTGDYDDAATQTQSATIIVGHVTSVTLTFTGTIPPSLTGTWIKQGSNPVLTDSQGINEPNVIYEGNPQILTGQTNVYKMWYRVGWDVGNINYAESTDGLTWTKYSSNPVISGGKEYCPHIFKYNGMYYCYVHHALTLGVFDSGFSRLISNNGINWAVDAPHCLTTGSGWENYNLGNPFVWVEDGQWKMIYEAMGTQWNLGYATSSDGKTWTKYSGNPVLIDGGGPYVIKVGNTYYMWYHAGQLPTDIYLATSTNLITWTKLGLVLRRTLPWEASQVADPTILVVGTEVWMWYTGVSAQSYGYQSIGAAILQPN